jgi:carboxyl-terminal processing protease
MAQLLGATYRIDLPNSKIGVNVPAERLYHVDGRPREAYQPTISVSGASGAADKVLDAAVDAIMSTAGHVE